MKTDHALTCDIRSPKLNITRSGDYAGAVRTSAAADRSYLRDCELFWSSRGDLSSLGELIMLMVCHTTAYFDTMCCWHVSWQFPMRAAPLGRRTSKSNLQGLVRALIRNLSSRGLVLLTSVRRETWILGFGVPYFNTFFLKEPLYEIKVYTFCSLVT